MLERMRCSRCLTRFRLTKRRNAYVNPIKCRNCKATTVYSIEASRRRQANKNTCHCVRLHYPHQRNKQCNVELTGF